ncbi:MAG: HipA domain-containing protein [Chthoniobacterales bacterium]
MGDLSAGEAVYHSACCRELFDASQPPLLPYSQEDIDKLATKVIRQHVTVPGVQPKLSLHLEREAKKSAGRFTIVGLEGGYILKPPVSRYPEMPELEHLTMRMAECFGITTAACGLLKMQDGRHAFIARRMDRSGVRKLPMEDMCQLTDRLTADKYRGSLESVGRAVLRYSNVPVFDALRLFDLVLFCFLTGNADMHLKNFSLLQNLDRETRLAPAYDLLPTHLLLPEDQEESALTLNGKKRKIHRNDFLCFGEALTLKARQMDNALRRSAAGIPAALALVDRGLCSEESKKRYAKLIKARAARLGF